MPARLFYSRLRCREACDRDTERRATHVVQAQVVAEFHRTGIASVLAADPDLEIRTDASPKFNRHPHDFPHSLYVEGRERIIGENALLQVMKKESRFSVVPGDPEYRLRQIVRSEREEISRRRNFVRCEGRPRDLDHRPELIRYLLLLFLHHFQRLGFHQLTLGLELVHV